MKPILVDPSILDKLKYPKVIEPPPIVKPPPVKEKIILQPIRQTSGFAVFINILGLIILFIGGYVLYDRKIHKKENIKRHEQKIIELENYIKN
jgi:hypothetical protein